MPYALNLENRLVQLPQGTTAVPFGYQLLSDQEAQAAAKEQAYGGAGGEALAGLAGAGRGATFGLSDLALTKSGLVAPETLKGLKETNPASSIAGEIAGIAGTSVLTGGLTGEAGAAEAAGSAAAHAGESALAKYGTAAAMNAAFGAGNAISEDALGESNLTAEKLWASAGLGAALGVGGEMLFGAAAAAAPKVLERAGSAMDGLKEALGSVYDKASSLVSGLPEDMIRDARLGRMAATAPGALEAENAATKEALGNIQQKAVDLAQEKSRGFKAALQQVDDAVGAVSKQIGRVRPQETESLLASADPEAAKAAATQKLQEISSALEGMRGDSVKFAYERPISAAEQLVKRTAENIQGAESAADVFHELNSFKQDFDPYLKFGGQPTPEAADTLAALKSQVRTPLKNMLEDAGTWGAAGARQGEVNQAFSEFINAKKALLSAEGFGRKVVSKSGSIERQISPQRIQSFIKDLSLNKQAADVRSQLLKNYMEAAEKLLGHAKTTFENVPTEGAPDLEAVRGLLAKSQGAQGEALEAQQAARALNKGRVVPYSNASNALGSSYADEFTAIPRESLPMGPAQKLAALKAGGKGDLGLGGLGAVGYAAHAAGAPIGPLGAAYTAYRSLANPGRTIETLAKVSRATEAVSNALKRGVKELFGGIKAGRVAEESLAKEVGEGVELKARQEFAREVPEKGLHKAAEEKLAEEKEPQSIGAMGETKLVPGERKQADRVAAYNQKSAQLASYTANPERFVNGLAAATSRLHEAAPKATKAFGAVAARAVQHLAQGAKNPNVGDMFHAEQYQPSDAELAKQERKFEVVNKGPVALLNAAKHGRLTPDMVQTGDTVFPKLMQELRGNVLDGLANHRGPINYSDRLQLGMLLGKPLEHSTQPAFIQRRQASFTAPPPQSGNIASPVVRSSQKGLSELSLSSSLMAPSQRLQRARE